MSGTSKTVVSMCVLLLAALVVYYGMTPPEEAQGTHVDIPKQRPSLFGGDPQEKLVEMGFPPVATKLTTDTQEKQTVGAGITETPAVDQRPERVEIEVETTEEEPISSEKVTVVEKRYKIYTVLEGETLGEIASRELGSYRMWREIAALNNIADPSRMMPGRVLRMPTSKASTSPVPVTPEVTIPTGTKVHIVEEGDTLSSIAGMYYDNVNKYGIIQNANPAINPNRLKIGQKILIPRE
jgi:nucleoid-associated protein YgaU